LHGAGRLCSCPGVYVVLDSAPVHNHVATNAEVDNFTILNNQSRYNFNYS
jgi:hypothetical protein